MICFQSIYKKLIIFLIFSGSIFKSGAQAVDSIVRPVTSSYMFLLGSSHLADTYLTPIKYKGIGTGIRYERSQAMKFNPNRWVMQLNVGLDADIVKNPVKNSTMYAGSVNLSWSMMHRWNIYDDFYLGIGPGTDLDLGVLYLSRNSNNPCSAKASWTIDASAFVLWKNKVGRLPFTLRYEATLPIIGAFFSPDYAQLYYQIYLGDNKGLAHVAWWKNYFRLNNLLTADLHFGSTSLRIGYKCDIFSTKVNDIVSRCITHMAVIGITTEWLALPIRSRSYQAKSIISAF